MNLAALATIAALAGARAEGKKAPQKFWLTSAAIGDRVAKLAAALEKYEAEAVFFCRNGNCLGTEKAAWAEALNAVVRVACDGLGLSVTGAHRPDVDLRIGIGDMMYFVVAVDGRAVREKAFPSAKRGA